MYHPPHGVHVPPVQRRNAQGARPQVVRPHGGRGGRAQRGSGHDQYDFGHHGSGFQSYSSNGPRFPLRGAHFPQMGHDMFGVFPNTFPGQIQFTNPSVASFSHPISFLLM
jgi:hypothetical protein